MLGAEGALKLRCVVVCGILRQPSPWRERRARQRGRGIAARTAWLLNGGVGESSGPCLRWSVVGLAQAKLGCRLTQAGSFGNAALLALVEAAVCLFSPAVSCGWRLERSWRRHRTIAFGAWIVGGNGASAEPPRPS
ncbi:hypothetical protein TraAM80_04390 [Trypanosoma rangeli]|uniref:Uncharacterized protein n=1 Tax=Trypanosoma rangeli TaxID=5698 RepID=A0A3R7NFH0_TRYRA|nr:uncharacterized protein TraAM80_04390 [Trypanosoma rangeli]RNF05764.1 hypothetical protein TraAM80_04390 [Trypanosoma rangeli]|eukprot:RNF05764.1 hypothetical protein TraAM80_04390 [Trypanosoma rangeli]